MIKIVFKRTRNELQFWDNSSGYELEKNWVKVETNSLITTAIDTGQQSISTNKWKKWVLSYRYEEKTG